MKFTVTSFGIESGGINAEFVVALGFVMLRMIGRCDRVFTTGSAAGFMDCRRLAVVHVAAG
ncbi:hypothetical protein [Neorhizobium tomejilense]|uniref:hypothetical protein n=1 Tax=Neorhizobium tomejilense TaxID=2093828 RepID=UPI003F4FD2C3